MKRSSNIRLFETCCLLLAAILSASAASGQVHGGPVRQGDSRPVSQGSRSVRSGSRPVYEPGISVSESSGVPISGSSVRDSAGADVHSGPVSDFSSGPVTSGQPVAGSGAVSDTKSYTFTHNVESLIGPGIPVHSLSRLQEQIRAIQPPPPPEGIAVEENVPAEPLAAEEAPAGESVTEPLPEEEIPLEESSEPQPEVETPGPEAAEPTLGEKPSEETRPEGEASDAEPAPGFTPRGRPEMPLVLLFFAFALLLLMIAGFVLYGIGVLIWRATHREPGADAMGPSKRTERHNAFGVRNWIK